MATTKNTICDSCGVLGTNDVYPSKWTSLRYSAVRGTGNCVMPTTPQSGRLNNVDLCPECTTGIEGYGFVFIDYKKAPFE